MILAGALGLGAAFVALFGGSEGAPPAVHENPAAGFRITPPDGWTRRTDDRDGSLIVPEEAPDGGFAALTVSARLAKDPDPDALMTDLFARPPSGPVRDLQWLERRQVVLDGGQEAVMAEFKQIYRGLPQHGWLVITVDGARMFQAVAVVPESLASESAFEMLASLRSLDTL